MTDPETPAERLVATLYRAILHREPDAPGLAGHAANLQAALDGGALIDPVIALVENFAASAEAHGLSARLGQIVPGVGPTVSPVGAFAQIISLGTTCYASWLIKAMGLKRGSYPIDWCFSSPSMLVDMLADDFTKFLDRSYYRTTPLELRNLPDENQCDHLYYLDEHEVRFVFNHRDPNTDDDYGYFLRAVARFRAAMASDAPKLMLMIDPHEDLDEAVFAQLAEQIDRLTTNAMLIAIRILPFEPRPFDRTGFATLATSGNHRLLSYAGRSPFASLNFDARIDDMLMQAVVGQYAVDLS